MNRLTGKVALISGAARGMGACEARMFSEEGARVVLGDVLDEQGQRVAQEINPAGGEQRALYVHLDVTQPEDWERAVSAAVTTFGRLDILVNNAAIIGSRQASGVEETTPDAWERIIDVNQTGVWLGMRAAIPAMRRSGGGSIINLSSISGMVAAPGTFAYHASKGAVRIMTKSAAVQYARENIRVNSVHPGPVDTPMTAELPPDRPTVRQTPLGRQGRPEEIAYGVLFLATDESSYMTGSELVIDGGFTAM